MTFPGATETRHAAAGAEWRCFGSAEPRRPSPAAWPAIRPRFDVKPARRTLSRLGRASNRPTVVAGPDSADRKQARVPGHAHVPPRRTPPHPYHRPSAGRERDRRGYGPVRVLCVQPEESGRGPRGTGSGAASGKPPRIGPERHARPPRATPCRRVSFAPGNLTKPMQHGYSVMYSCRLGQPAGVS